MGEVVYSSQIIEAGFCLFVLCDFLFPPQGSNALSCIYQAGGFCYNTFCIRELGARMLLMRTIDFCLFVYLLLERTEAVSCKALASLEELYWISRSSARVTSSHSQWQSELLARAGWHLLPLEMHGTRGWHSSSSLPAGKT